VLVGDDLSRAAPAIGGGKERLQRRRNSMREREREKTAAVVVVVAVVGRSFFSSLSALPFLGQQPSVPPFASAAGFE